MEKALVGEKVDAHKEALITILDELWLGGRFTYSDVMSHVRIAFEMLRLDIDRSK